MCMEVRRWFPQPLGWRPHAAAAAFVPADLPGRPVRLLRHDQRRHPEVQPEDAAAERLRSQTLLG